MSIRTNQIKLVLLIIQCSLIYPMYSDNEDLAKWTFSDKVLKNRACNITISPKHDG